MENVRFKIYKQNMSTVSFILHSSEKWSESKSDQQQKWRPLSRCSVPPPRRERGRMRGGAGGWERWTTTGSRCSCCSWTRWRWWRGRRGRRRWRGRSCWWRRSGSGRTASASGEFSEVFSPWVVLMTLVGGYDTRGRTDLLSRSGTNTLFLGFFTSIF